MITIVCCYNDKEMLYSMLLQSLQKQLGVFNIIEINAYNFNFKSAANAYNEVLKCPKKYGFDEISEYLLFVHQDIYLEDCEFLLKIEKKLKSLPQSILGLAGITKEGKVYSNLKYRNTNQFITNRQLSDQLEVESVDECCFALSKQLWENVRFDETVCYHWHLYAVEFCYNAKKLFGSKSYILPYSCFHKYSSDNGLETDSYFLNTMWKLIKKHKNHFNKIFAPCYIVSTNYYNAIYKLLRTYVKNILKNFQ